MMQKLWSGVHTSNHFLDQGYTPLRDAALKVKVHVYSPDIRAYRSSRLYINYSQVLKLTLSQFHLQGENAAQFSSAVAIHTVQIFVPPGTQFAGWKEAVWIQSLHQAFCTKPAL